MLPKLSFKRSLKNTGVLFLIGILAILFSQCQQDVKQSNKNVKDNTITNTENVKVEIKKDLKIKSKADSLVDLAIEAHGGVLYDQANYQFEFRGKRFSFKNNGSHFEYSVDWEKEGNAFHHTYNNQSFERLVNGQMINLPDTVAHSYANSLNSVIYFATLPHKLSDPAVHSKYNGEQMIKGQTYDLVEVRFSEEGGGDDFDDTYMYWFNQKDHTIDFLAYNYQVNEGGVRFRNAHNRRTVEGIIFQDYENYKAEVGTPLEALAKMYESGDLKLLSNINTENIKKI